MTHLQGSPALEAMSLSLVLKLPSFLSLHLDMSFDLETLIFKDLSQVLEFHNQMLFLTSYLSWVHP